MREERSITGSLPEAAAGFTQVIAELSCSGGPFDRVHMEFLNGDRVLASSEVIRVATEDQLRPVVFSVSKLRTLTQAPEEFRLVFAGHSRRSHVASVAFIELPSRAISMAQEGLGEPRIAGGVVRRAVSLLTTDSAVADVELRAGESVRFFLAIDPRLRRPRERLRFIARLEDAAHADAEALEPAAIEKGFLNPKDGWKNITLSAPKDGRYRMTVLLHSALDFGVGFGLVGEAHVQRHVVRPPESPSPLVLLITSDTHRGDHLGILNADSPVETPHLDALARRGVLFEDCFSQTNVTIPSHIALLTGTHPRDTGILDNRTRLAEQARTLAECYAAAGYQTLAATSTFHLLHESCGLGQGFDRMVGPEVLYRDGEVAIEALLPWIDDDRGSPTFAWLHLFDAHAPYGPPPPYDRKYYGDGDPLLGRMPDLPESVLRAEMKGLRDLTFPYEQYRAEVDYLDGALAQLLRHPRVQGGITAFTADHGESFGRHGIWWSHTGLYPDTVHIPLILAWPGAPAGLRVPAPVRQMDVARTLLNLSGLNGTDFPGRDLAWSWEQPEAREPRYLLAAHGISASIEVDGWQLILELRPNHPGSNETRRAFGEVTLHYRPEDPYCEVDLLTAELARARKLRTRLLEWLTEPRSISVGETAGTTAQDEQMLAALGYAGDSETEPPARLWDPTRYGGRGWESSPWRLMFDEPD